ncbi:hypothetical protein [Hydrogenophaga sp.]|uniref:hypothetical protein n=1 Tax=Hydrogenophaga sp. TaxID=1904254 RepID=UPI0026090535|nr:hypothetical protein [Hydrogenophaga sp.]MDM7948432.1 hypothetical protein [Hydrogenophaga sp.]
MTCHALPNAGLAEHSVAPAASEARVATLIGQVYEVAPAADRRRLLEYLLPRVGVLSLAVVADGLFARILFRNESSRIRVGLEDVGQVQGNDVSALVERLQQVSTDAIYGLAQIVAASPVMASSAAAALLVTVLVQRARAQAADDADPGNALAQAAAPSDAP